MPCKQPLGQCWEQGELAGSPTSKLQSCHERLVGRPKTAPQQQPRLGAPGSPGRRRPASGSPAQVKPLMQVKRELDRAVAELRSQAQRFRASPLPLSTMEPRYQQEVQQQEQRRQAAHEQRRQQLLAAQQPFGMEEREAERQERRLLVHGGASWGPTEDGLGRQCSAPAFHAQPVPVATTEVRLAGWALTIATLWRVEQPAALRQLHCPGSRSVACATDLPPACTYCLHANIHG